MRTRLKHLAKLLVHPDYRKRSRSLQRLRKLSKYQRGTTNLLGPRLELMDAPSFLYMHNEIFEREIYRFNSKTPTPYIVDGGANIGLSVLYFKRLYPQSRIVTFEPDEGNFGVLCRNLKSFGISDVETINKALWDEETTLEFIAEGADAGRVSTGEIDVENPLPGTICQVQAVRLRSYLQEPVDFLKLDIEGAETCVLEDCRDLLGNVSNIFIEYHSFAERPQSLPQLLEILQASGFRLYLDSFSHSPRPFMHHDLHLGMDLLVNVFGFREQ